MADLKARTDPLTIHEINALPQDAFVRLFGGIYEHSPWVAEGAFGSLPFTDRDALVSAMRAVVESAAADMRVGILCAHPQLSGKEARQGTLTTNSTREQTRLSLNSLAGPELQRMLDLNRGFMEKFGFPGIVAVRLHDAIDGVFAELERRIGNEYAREVQDALEQVHHIARFRLHDMVDEDPAAPG